MAARAKSRQYPTAYKLKAIKRVGGGEGVLPVARKIGISRKATSTALADASATPHQIMAVTGHQTLEEVERYTKAANRKKTADTAMRKLAI